MADVWYFAHDGESHGPFSAAQLKEQAGSGRIRPQDSVWRGGTEKKVAASRVQHLFTDAQRSSAEAAEGPSALVPANPQPAPVPLPSASPISPVAVPPVSPDDIPNDAELLPLEPPPKKQPEVRKRRAISIKGGDIMSQDGVKMKYRKKCPPCGYQDTSMTTASIPMGSLRVNFYCPKCKKNRQVEIQGA